MKERTHILLGVTGGIAAYKSADLVRRLVERNFDVRVVMTNGACEFVTPLTFQALSGNPVHRDLFDEAAEAAMGHIELARWADLVVVSPASADFISKLTHGAADDLLSTLCLATTAKVLLAPAMNQQMWANMATQTNVATLRERGVWFLGPAEGEQACGEVGAGRMVEPIDIAERVVTVTSRGDLSSLAVLVTAGPTREAIDPVRYLSNHSSGKMGYAVAQAAADAGADVTLVSGPTALAPPSGVLTVDVTSVSEMHEEVMSHVMGSDIFIGAAAVADYAPCEVSGQKIKKHTDTLSLSLSRTTDILAQVSGLSNPPFTVGFAAETEDLESNAQHKLRSKSLDMIAANKVGQPGSGFGSDYNVLNLYWCGGGKELPHAPKTEIARELIEIVASRYHAKNPA